METEILQLIRGEEERRRATAEESQGIGEQTGREDEGQERENEGIVGRILLGIFFFFQRTLGDELLGREIGTPMGREFGLELWVG